MSEPSELSDFAGEGTPPPPSFTKTEAKLLAILADGLPHAHAELHPCLPDDLGARVNLRIHMSHIRAKLRPLGQTVLCEWYGYKYCYRHVILLVPGAAYATSKLRLGGRRKPSLFDAGR